MVQFKDENGNWVKAAEDYAYSWGQAGMVVQFAGAASKVPPHWLLCDGSEYDCSAYPNLFNAIGYMYGGSGSKFKVPDYRECALVGAGKNGTDTMEAHDVYDLGEFKDDQLQNITGAVARIGSGGTGAFYGTNFGYRAGIEAGGGYLNTNFDASRAARAGLVTHGKQKGVNYIIHI